MPFDVIEIVSARRDQQPASVTLSKMGVKGARPRCTVAIIAALAAEFKASDKDRFEVMLGSGEHRGLLRLRKNKSGPIKPRALKGGGLFFNLGFIEQFGGAGQAKEFCEAAVIDPTTIEVTLPAWADGKPKPSVAGTPIVTSLQRQTADEAAARRKRLGM
jgi:hypothetical protein